MELIKDIPFCSSGDKQFKLDLCLPESVDKLTVKKHVKFKTSKVIKHESRTLQDDKPPYSWGTRRRSGSQNEFSRDVDVINSIEFCERQVEVSAKTQSQTNGGQSKAGKLPFVIFVHGGGWRRGGKQAWKHYLYYDVNFLVAILQWLFNLHRNVGISLAQCGIGCALISYPLTEQNVPYVWFEMLMSYSASCFVTFLGLFPIYLFFYLLQMHGSSRVSWLHVFSGNRHGFIPSTCALSILLTTNTIILVLFTLKKDKFKVTTIFLVIIWSLLTTLTFLLGNLMTATYQLTFFTLLTFMFTQGLILRRRLLRLNVTYADQAKVVARAVHWTKRLARKSGQFDRERIYLMGHSAGGHLTTLTVLDDSFLKEVFCSAQDIKGVISLAGVYDLDCLNAKFLKQTYLVPNFGEHKLTWRKASPFHQVKKSKTTRRPKFLLMSAELDPVLIKQSHAFSEKLTNMGLECEHVTVHGSNHFTIITNLVRIFGENDQSVLKLTVNFISKVDQCF